MALNQSEKDSLNNSLLLAKQNVNLHSAHINSVTKQIENLQKQLENHHSKLNAANVDVANLQAVISNG